MQPKCQQLRQMAHVLSAVETGDMLESVQRSFTMNTSSDVTIQVLVFSLVAAAFTTVYITQPVLPVIENEFAIDARTASLSISMVILGIALANLPFGILADHFPIKPILLTGGTVITATSLTCAATHSIGILIAARFIQGLFIPSLTTCLAAYLAKSLPVSRLNVVMGSYVSATVAGGMGGRLLGGWIHPPLHWRYAFVSASVLLITATIAACRWLPVEKEDRKTELQQAGFIQLLAQPSLWRVLVVAFSAYFVFSSMFNYLPFYLSQAAVFSAYRGHHAHVLSILDRNRHGSAVRETEQSHGKRRNNCDRFFAAGRSRQRHVDPVSRSDRGEPCFNVREFFQHPRRRHRLAQPETYFEPRTGQFALRFVLLFGRHRRHHGVRVCLRQLRLERRRWARHRCVAVTLGHRAR